MNIDKNKLITIEHQIDIGKFLLKAGNYQNILISYLIAKKFKISDSEFFSFLESFLGTTSLILTK